MADLLQEALEYARRGWYVFPCREKPGQPYEKNGETITPLEKTPYISKGLNNATIDEDQIRTWWTLWKDALIGVNAGRSGLFVVDIDKKHVNGLTTYETWDINDSAGLKSITPSGGMHIIFSGIGKSTTNAKTGIDTRGEGGYFIAPPSKVLEGEFVGEYKRHNDWSNSPGVIPDGLMARLFPESTTEFVRGNTMPTDGNKKNLSRRTLNFMVMGAIEGERNSSLFKAVADMAGCGYSQEEARDFLTPTCEKIGLSMSELEQVLIHAFDKPRTPSIPDSIQEKIMTKGKDVAGEITLQEQAIMEDAVLACMMMDNSSIPVIQDILNYDDFRVLTKSMIYRVINEMYASGMRIDHLTVANELAKKTDKVTLDDIAMLTARYYVNTDNAVTYASIIKEKASLRRLEALLDNKDKYLKNNIVESINSLEKDVADLAVNTGTKSGAVLTASQAVEMVTQRTDMLNKGQIEQLKIGFSVYDTNVGGLYSNELVVCAARSGDGKSALALSIINDVSIRQGKPSVLFTLEMSTHESICRLICQLTGLPFKNVYQGKLKTEKEWDDYRAAKTRIAESPIYFDDGFGMTVPEIRSKIRKLLEKGIKLVVIDQLEQVKGYEGLKVNEQFDKIAYDIKNLTKEFDVPIILNHQMNRNVMDRRLKNPEPILSDLNYAGEKPANQVWVISHNKDDKGNILQSKIKVLKNRNGPRIEFAVIYVGERMLFSTPTREEDMYVFHSNEDDADTNSYQNALNNQDPWFADSKV